MIIEVLDGYELRCTDGMNWQVFQLRQREKRGSDKKRTGIYEEEWVGLPSFHGTVDAGICWIVDNVPKSAKNREARKSLSAYLEDLKKINAQIARSAKTIAKSSD